MALTEKDLRAIGALIDEKFQRLPTREEVKALIVEATEGLEKEMGELLSREEFLTFMDPVVGDLQSQRQEHTMLNSRVRNHEDRITDIEEIHPGGSHAS